ncbi:MAG: hypothetical protein AB7I30_02510 [Isosphaeraceae bacterium]
MDNMDARANLDEFGGVGSKNRTLCLFLLSVAGLFLELVLIRWVSTEIRIFAYLQNTVLVVCFLGLGVGALSCRKPVAVREILLPLGVLIALLAIPATRAGLGKISEMLSVLNDLLIWSKGRADGPWQSLVQVALGLALTLVLMILIWEIFLPIGRLTGRFLADHPRTLWAYSVNVAGGLLGVWAFVLLSALDQPPFVWVAVFCALLAALTIAALPPTAGQSLPSLVGMAALIPLAWFAGQEPDAIEVRWSPYQKLALQDSDPNDLDMRGVGRYMVTVNRAGYQAMIDLNPESVARDPDRYPPALRGLSQYDVPFLLRKPPGKVLVVGAGTGNDVAGALRQGATEVTAVEIDPAILDLGKRFHPERPYDSPRVHAVTDDARSFFASCQEKYDLILFGLLDSHTTTAMTNARLDHYVYTVESLRHARTLLADGGVMVLSFEAQKPYVADRMALALRQVFGEEPLCFRIPKTAYGWGGVMFVTGDLNGVRQRLAENPRLASTIARWRTESPVRLTGTTRVATDDWPYIYLESPRIPSLHFLLAGLLAVVFAYGVRGEERAEVLKGWDASRWHFFFMGAAFLLLEVQNVSKASVVLGNTWQVNAVIISGILAMVLLANLVVAKRPNLSSPVVYLGLILTCLVLYFVDLSTLAFLPFWVKAPMVGALAALPMLFSGVVFARSFASSAEKDQALGANILGALVGGILQSLTFVTGTRFLSLVVAALYAAAYLTRPGKPHARPLSPHRNQGRARRGTRGEPAAESGS